jgi:hypothetical protein
MLFYTVSAAAPTDSDVVSRRLAVTVNGVARDSVEFGPTATTFGEFGVTEGDTVTVTLVDIDDAGNESAPASLEFTAADTLPPATPDLGVTLVREE